MTLEEYQTKIQAYQDLKGYFVIMTTGPIEGKLIPKSSFDPTDPISFVETDIPIIDTACKQDMIDQFNFLNLPHDSMYHKNFCYFYKCRLE